MQERAAREAAERERLRREGEAACRAARQRAQLERQQQQEQAQEHSKLQQRGLHAPQQPGSRAAAGGGAYLQRLQGRHAQQGHAPPRLPEWAQPARLLPPLLLPASASASPAQQDAEPTLQPGSARSLGEAASSAAGEAKQLAHALQQGHRSVEAAAKGVHASGMVSVEEGQPAALPAAGAAGCPGPVQGGRALCLRLSDSELELQQLQADLARLDSSMAQHGERPTCVPDQCSACTSEMQRGCVCRPAFSLPCHAHLPYQLSGFLLASLPCSPSEAAQHAPARCRQRLVGQRGCRWRWHPGFG